MLFHAKLDPTVVVGGKVDSLGGNAKMGQGEFLVAEADESDGSFLKLAPVIEVVTNIDLEHLDYYRDIEHIKQSFLEFIDKVPFYGAVVLCLDDKNIADILPAIQKRTMTYGFTSQADIYAEKIAFSEGRICFTVMKEGKPLGDIDIAPPGRHNVYNALAAVCVGLELEIPFVIIQKALQSYQGVQRRMQLKGCVNGITVVDDYGHHPTEITVTLEAIKEAWPEKRLVVVFQPHRYSRTKALYKEFLTCFHRADYLVMTDIYSAGEKSVAGISSESLLKEISQHGQRHTFYIERIVDIPEKLQDILQKDDLVLTLGAGNIVNAGEKLVQYLQEKTSVRHG
jgi:UDP-N-acetylmuramate--alanine ligase